MLSRVRNNGWRPQDPLPYPTKVPEVDGKSVGQRDAQKVMKTLVREALYVSARGLPEQVYVDSISRLQLNNVLVGDKYASGDFLETVERLSAKYLELQDGLKLAQKMPGLGVRSPLGIVFDTVTLGGGMYSRHESLQVIMLTFVGNSGRLESMLLDSPSVGLDKGGEAQAKGLVAAFRNHAAELTIRSLQQCMVSIIGGDGAVTKGGPQSVHQSTKAAEHLYAQVYGNADPFCEWDKWHRGNTAFEPAFREHTGAQEVLTIARAMNQHFGTGAGQVLIRSVAEEMQERVSQVHGCGGTRHLLTMTFVGRGLLKNFRVYVTGFHAKVNRRQRGKGSQTQSSLAAIGRRLSALDFLSFLTVFDSVMQQFDSFGFYMQKEAQEAWMYQDPCS